MCLTPPELWPLFLRLTTRIGRARLSDLDLRELTVAATAEGLLGLLFEEEGVPAEVRAALPRVNALRILVARRAELQHQSVSRFLDVVGADRVLFFKGFDNRHRLYPAPHLRPSADVDAFVPSHHLREVLARLGKAGLRQVISAHGAVWAPGYYEIGIDVGEVRIDIHRAIGHTVRAAVDYEELWQARVMHTATGVLYACPAPLHAMAVHMLNLAKDEFSAPLVRFVDFYLMLQQWREEIPELVPLAKRWRIERAAYASLSVLTNLFPSACTELLREVMCQLLTPRARRFLDERVLPDRTKVASGHGSRLTQLWRKYWLTDTSWRRVAFAAYYVWAAAAGSLRERTLYSDAVEQYRQSKTRPE